MSMDMVGVFQGFTPESGVLVLAFKQKIERRRNAALTKTHKCFMILSTVYVDFLKKSILFLKICLSKFIQTNFL